MEYLKAESRQKLLGLFKEVVWKPSICVCDKLISGIFHIDKVEVIGKHFTVVSATLLDKPGNMMTYFMGYDLQKRTCQHPGITKVELHITASQWEAIGSSNAELAVYHAEYFDSKVVCSDRFSAVLPFRAEPHPIDEDEIRVGELFTGGFSGWSQVIQRLRKGSVPIRHVWGLDHNSVAGSIHSILWGSCDFCGSLEFATPRGILPCSFNVALRRHGG